MSGNPLLDLAAKEQARKDRKPQPPAEPLDKAFQTLGVKGGLKRVQKANQQEDSLRPNGLGDARRVASRLKLDPATHGVLESALYMNSVDGQGNLIQPDTPAADVWKYSVKPEIRDAIIAEFKANPTEATKKYAAQRQVYRDTRAKRLGDIAPPAPAKTDFMQTGQVPAPLDPEQAQAESLTPFNDPFKQSAVDSRPENVRLDEAVQELTKHGEDIGGGIAKALGGNPLSIVNPLTPFPQVNEAIGKFIGGTGAAIVATPASYLSAIDYAADESHPPFDRTMSFVNAMFQAEAAVGGPVSGQLFHRAIKGGYNGVRALLTHISPQEAEGIAKAAGIAVQDVEKGIQSAKQAIEDPKFDREAFTKQLIAQEEPMTIEPGPKFTVKAKAIGKETPDLAKENPNAIQEQTANESVLRQERPELGLQEMGSGDTQVEVSPQGPETQAQKEVTAPKTPTPPEPPQTGVHAPKNTIPEATGLANQVQEEEALSGIIKQVEPTKGASDKAWLKAGQKAVSEGADYMRLAEDVGAGKEELTGEKVGILTEGKRIMLSKLKRLRNDLELDPKNYSLNQLVAQKEAELSTYLDNIQAGKGRWSDAGRALMSGTELDTGNYVEVLKRAERTGRLTEDVAKDLTDKANQISDITEKESGKQAEIDRLKAELAELRKNAGQGDFDNLVNTYTKKRLVNRAAVQKELDDIAKEFASLKPGSVPRSRRGGAVSLPDPRKANLYKRAAIAHIKMGVANLEDVVIQVQKFFRDRAGVEVPGQDIIDALALKDERKPLSEGAMRSIKVRAEARAKSTTATAERALRRQASYNAGADIKAAQKEMDDAKKGAWAHMKDAQRAWEAGENIKNAEARKAYRDWWNVQMDISDLKHQIETGEFKAPNIKPEAPETEISAMRKARDEWKAKANTLAAIQQGEGQLKSGIFVAKAKRAIEVSDELTHLRAKRALVDSQVKARLDELSRPKLLNAAVRGAKFLQSLKLGSDAGQLFRQGVFLAKKPEVFLKSIGEGLKAATSDEAVARWKLASDDRLINGKHALSIERRAGLDIPNVLGHNEEMISMRLLSDIGEKFKGTKAGKLPGSLERFQKVFINHARRMDFDNAVRAGFDERELKQVAHYINNVTGRGNVRFAPGAFTDIANILLTSKNYEMSRWGTIAEPAKNLAQLYKRGEGGGLSINRGSVRNLKDMAAQAAVVSGLYLAAAGQGYKVSLDPSSPDFLKMRKGDEVWDISAGLAPRVRDLLLIAGSVLHPGYGHAVRDEVGKAVTRTFSPGITTPALALSAKAQDTTTPKNPMTGMPMDEYDYTWKALLPQVVAAFDQFNKDGNFGSALGASAKEFFGTSVQKYPEKSSRRERKGRN